MGPATHVILRALSNLLVWGSTACFEALLLPQRHAEVFVLLPAIIQRPLCPLSHVRPCIAVSIQAYVTLVVCCCVVQDGSRLELTGLEKYQDIKRHVLSCIYD